MSDINIEMFPALGGDCLLVTLGNKKKTNILIDGGYKETFYNYLKPRLQHMKKNGERLDLVIVTHIDADHIEGIIELLRENGSSKKANIISIGEIWHNSYRHLQFLKDNDKKIDFREKAILLDKIVQGYQNKQCNSENTDISAKDGSTLAALIYAGGYNWNTSFNGSAINVDSKELININSEFKLRLLAPNSNSLQRLSKFWLKELRKEKYDFTLTDNELFDDAFEFFMLNQSELQYSDEDTDISNRKENIDIESLATKKESLDNSPVNGSSICFIVEYQQKKVLFLADSLPQVIYSEIQKLVEKESYIPTFDLIKVSHHGSSRNTTQKLLELIDSKHFFFSTNGKKHKHPSPETIAKIVIRNGGLRKLFFNYPLTYANFLREDLQLKYNYVIESPPEGEKITSIKV
ncbi:MBL fold metallo-hydrolase [Bacillus sp. NTK071]|uniref:AVAST type 1 anti-phage system MBL fold metallo-hydrolase Avs1a n=1 Tax=Bacillus sp. NTK071 TaxID=2802175 RepID=UPI001A8D5E71|nr:AVAST type 1 anti-phage system MBL fold metallo-hydrolase Avs1a [Bacillus sp. NTK071]MBN8211092.1 MBL fold metallo-hydrolase [Bacillus sp. NTK071]